jgi:hypothetical protein
MPRDHGRGLHDRERVGPSRPDAGDDDPEGAVYGAKLWTGPAALEHGELLAEHEDLYDETRAGAEAGDERVEQGREDGEHHPNLTQVAPLVTGESPPRIE